ncbi:MAG TPA: CDGSH iron-sulfur domain-containing protein [Steroidobacteraceae bacterium]|nr:CDGSH iron-sulfur domain-containing protein [Steroidobacteraceae bacterium]
MPVEIVKGREATIHFDAGRCIHSRSCVLSHPDVFVPNVEGAWIHPDAQPVEELMHLAKSCPSGAIRVMRNAPSTGAAADSDAPPVVNTVRVRENGPLAVEAQLRIRGVAQASPRATLCRCGASQNKPFCDGSHAAAGFQATGEPVGVESAALSLRNGPLNVMPLPNGPLRVVGSLEVVSGTGRTCNRVGETFLCRCGASKNKPYCDGSHKGAGFQAG